MNLSTSYLGLALRNPLIVSSSGLTGNLDKIKKLEQMGAGAVVVKSLFEEQIAHDVSDLMQYNDFPEALDYIKKFSKSSAVDEYCELIFNAKKETSIPIFASVNCFTDKEWTNFALKMKEAGADAIELNICIIPSSKNDSSDDIEKQYYNIVKKVKGKLGKDFPVVVKVGYQFTNLLHFVDKLGASGASAVVLFNRFFEPDFDIENYKLISSEIFSNPSDVRNTLRWLGILSGKLKLIELSASTGIHGGRAAIKAILAGATTVQVCSTVYRNGIQQVKKILEDMEIWMNRQNYETIDQFRGKLNYRNYKEPAYYERAQFMKYYASIE